LPRLSVVAVRENEVSVFLAVTAVWGITAPVESRTTPSIVAVVVCAYTGDASAAANARTAYLSRLIDAPRS
jgi:hypothetical protein